VATFRRGSRPPGEIAQRHSEAEEAKDLSETAAKVVMDSLKTSTKNGDVDVVGLHARPRGVSQQ
jgi:hypothetical protein